MCLVPILKGFAFIAYNIRRKITKIVLKEYCHPKKNGLRELIFSKVLFSLAANHPFFISFANLSTSACFALDFAVALLVFKSSNKMKVSDRQHIFQKPN